MIIQHPANLDQELNKELLDIAKKIDCKAKLGKTMCTYDFYEGNYTLLRQ
jgi:uridine phosphorylase